MSFILDALRKSEAARRRSEAPDLFATMPQAAEPERARHAWPLWAIAGIGVLSLIVAIWLVSRPPATQAPTASTTGTARIEGADVEMSEAPVAPIKAIAATPSAETSPIVESPATPIAPVATPPAAASLPAPSPSTSTSPSAATAPTTTAPNVTPRDLPTPPTPLPAAPPASDQPIALADLDPATRNQLPPLKLSMHLWNETPSGRFVILDGQRLKEGDVLGELVIERITRDGAVLVWRGGRLKIALQ
jgi:general secretion pathway protein B